MVGFLTVAAAAVLYALGIRRLRRKGRRWPGVRTTAFLGGVAVIGGALVLGPADDDFTAHMAEHVALGLVGPLALALGAPVTLAIQASHRPTQVAILSLLRNRVVRTITHPVVTWTWFATTPFVVYFTPFFGWSLRNDFVHGAIHAHFLFTGTLFFWPAVGLDPTHRRLAPAARVLYLFLAVPFHAVLGLSLLSADQILGGGSWTLDNQRSGAALMWTAGEVVGLVATLVATAQWMQADAREAQRWDRLDQASARSSE